MDENQKSQLDLARMYLKSRRASVEKTARDIGKLKSAIQAGPSPTLLEAFRTTLRQKEERLAKLQEEERAFAAEVKRLEEGQPELPLRAPAEPPEAGPVMGRGKAPK